MIKITISSSAQGQKLVLCPIPPPVLDGPQAKSARGGAVLISLTLLREGGAQKWLKTKQTAERIKIILTDDGVNESR